MLALGLALLRNADPVQQIVVSWLASLGDPPCLLLCWLFLLAQTIQLERPFTGIVDTFLLPPLIVLAIWQTPAWGRRSSPCCCIC